MEMTDYKDMLLESASGFMMPFALEDKEELSIILPFGEQTHPKTGERFQHKGIDYAIKDRPLYAIASGMVSVQVMTLYMRIILSHVMESMRLLTAMYQRLIALMVQMLRQDKR